VESDVIFEEYKSDGFVTANADELEPNQDDGAD